MFDSFELFIAHFAFDHIRGGRTDHRFFLFIQEFHTLYCGICSLVKLSRKKFYRKDACVLCHLETFFVKGIYRRFCKNGLACFFKNIIRYIFHIITNQYSDSGQSGYSQIFTEFMPKILCLYSKSRLLFHIYSSYAAHKFLHALYWLVRYLSAIVSPDRFSDKSYFSARILKAPRNARVCLLHYFGCNTHTPPILSETSSGIHFSQSVRQAAALRPDPVRCGSLFPRTAELCSSPDSDRHRQNRPRFFHHNTV